MCPSIPKVSGILPVHVYEICFKGCCFHWKLEIGLFKVSKGAKIRNRYNQVPDPGYTLESDKLKADTTNESKEVSPFPAGDHKAHINRRAQRLSKHKTEQKHKRSTKEVPPWNGQ